MHNIVNTQPMIETPTGTNTTKVPFLGDGRATTAAWQSKKYRQIEKEAFL
jgi:hypothetical protein